MALVPYEIPDFNARIEEIITTQFRDQPVIHKHLRMWVEELEELGITFQSLAQDRAIDNATGDVLDIIGRIVGQERTIVGADLYDFFGFKGHIQALGFGDNYVEGVGGRWWSLGAPMGGDVTLTDEQYRQVIKARIMRNTSRGTCEDMLAYIRFVFGVDGKFTWNEGGVARVGVGRKLSQFEKALIAAEFSFQRYPTYYSPKPLGVALELFEYDSVGTLGFIGTPNAKGMIVLSNPNPDGGIFASVKYFDELPPQPPAYEVDFSKDQNFPAELNFTRASTATYYDGFGVIRTAAANVPRIDFDPSTGACLGLLLEESRTNMLLQSETFTSASWSKQPGMTVTADADGWYDVAHNGSANYLYMHQSGRPNTNKFATVYFDLKPGSITGASVLLGFNGTQNAARVSFDLDAGTSTTSAAIGVITGAMVTHSIKNMGGYWRCTVTVDATSTSITAATNSILLYTGAVVSAQVAGNIKVRRAQAEGALSPSSYIPTTTATVTRAADNCKTSALSLPNDGYTVYVDYIKGMQGYSYPLIMSDSATALGNYVGIRYSANTVYLDSTEGSRSSNLPVQTLGVQSRGAFCVSNNMPLNRLAQNGEISEDRVNTLPVVALGSRNILKLGTVINSVLGIWHIKKYSVYTVPFSAEQLNYLTYVT